MLMCKPFQYSDHLLLVWFYIIIHIHNIKHKLYIAQICSLIRLSIVILVAINSGTQLKNLVEYYIQSFKKKNEMFKK